MISDPFSGAISALMNVLNFGNTIGRQQSKLFVNPILGTTHPNGEPCICIEVVNKGAVKVKITDIGFNRRDRKRLSYSLLGHRLTNGQSLPFWLEPRDSITAYFHASDVDPTLTTNAYATTACGKTQQGDNALWKELREDFATQASTR